MRARGRQDAVRAGSLARWCGQVLTLALVTLFRFRVLALAVVTFTPGSSRLPTSPLGFGSHACPCIGGASCSVVECIVDAPSSSLTIR